jgi:hypothetical protein
MWNLFMIMIHLNIKKINKCVIIYLRGEENDFLW